MNQGQDQLKNGLWNRDAGLNDRILRRLFAIGDIHGCATALKPLIESIDPKPKDTTEHEAGEPEGEAVPF